MDIEQILSEFERPASDGFPAAAVREAVARREEITPRLLNILQDLIERPDAYTSCPGMPHVYAMFLLAQFRETRAYPLLVHIFSVPGDFAEDLIGDSVTDGLDSILASVSGGDPSGIQLLIENEEADEWVRWAALDAIVILVAAGWMNRETAIEYFAGLFLRLGRGENAVWDGLAVACASLCAAGLRRQLRRAYERHLVDRRTIGRDELDADLARDWESSLPRLREHKHLIDDVEKEISWWYCFQPESERAEREDIREFSPANEDWRKSPLRVSDSEIAVTLVDSLEASSARKTIGRNQPCPCGSGKKFKKCCGA